MQREGWRGELHWRISRLVLKVNEVFQVRGGTGIEGNGGNECVECGKLAGTALLQENVWGNLESSLRLMAHLLKEETEVAEGCHPTDIGRRACVRSA